MPKAMIITVGTGRNREDIAGGITFSIKRENPNRIFFLVTPQSKSETLPIIIKKSGLTKRKYKIFEHEEADDIQKLYLSYEVFFRKVLENGFSPNDIVIDYTSGTKAMSAALFAVGIAREVGGVTYISGERDKGGRVIPGTEKQVSPNLTMLRLGIKLRKLPELFNNYQFEACLSLLSDFESMIADPILMEKIDFFKKLAEAYMLWDRFNLDDSMGRLTEITRKYESLLVTHELKNYVEHHKKFLHKEKSTPYSVERKVDLYANARRRYEEGKYDDCVARIYRAMEYTAQVRLYLKHERLETNDLQIENLRDKLNEAAIGEYEDMRRGKDRKIQLGLVESYSLLEKLGDEFGKHFMREFSDNKSDLKKYLNIRNRSILAHGFTPVGKEGAEKFMGVFKSYLDKFIPEWEEIYKTVAFPKLSDVKWF